eukprot:TRINITY_DN48344_c0_g1_i1.p1 TRINITY_DN48344_c0_g1~~TRINITY_DN48344_c0_g1_i1.p1  ORF type:complete len:391 (+),score=61.58 TRINITY_DN48344_c0_g1_i1:63-1175(+)
MSYQGIIKSLSYETGYGFLECAQTHAIYGKDIFFMKTALGGYYGKKGDPVTFSVESTDKGPRGNFVQVISDHPTFVGEVKSFNAQKGWGMISCEVTQKLYGKDIFMLRTACIDGYMANAGDSVRFSVEESPKGPQARDVKGLERKGAGGSLPGDDTPQLLAQLASIQQKLSRRGVGVPATGAMSAYGVPPRGGNMSQGGGTYSGVVKSYNGMKGWGMIECGKTHAMYGKDMFFLRTSLLGAAEGANPGEQVQFTVQMGQKGPEARDIKILGSSSYTSYAPVVGGSGGSFTGIVKSFNVEKGWGFIACDETMQIYGKDMFLHKNALGDYVPSVGEQIQFTATVGQNGQPQAGSISIAGRSVGAGRARAAPY